MSQNLYSYVGNNPINYFDPTGHKKESNNGVVVYNKADVDNAFPSGTPTITIIVDQAVDGERIVRDFQGDENVGYTAIRIDDGNGNTKVIGYYPFDSKNKDFILAKDVRGAKGNDQEFYDDEYWDIGMTFEITNEQYNDLLNYTDNYTRIYNAESRNCTTFALDALESVGITGLFEEHNWSVMRDSWFKEYSLFGQIVGLYEENRRGYTPADLAEDIRSFVQ